MIVEGVKTHYADYCFPFVIPFNAMGNPVLVVPGQQDASKLPLVFNALADIMLNRNSSILDN